MECAGHPANPKDTGQALIRDMMGKKETCLL
jgi:hypothetical protein